MLVEALHGDGGGWGQMETDGDKRRREMKAEGGERWRQEMEADGGRWRWREWRQKKVDGGRWRDAEVPHLHGRDALAPVALLHADVDEVLLLVVGLSIGKGVGATARHGTRVRERVCGPSKGTR